MTTSPFPNGYGIYRVNFEDGSYAVIEGFSAANAVGVALHLSGEKYADSAFYLRDATEEEHDNARDDGSPVFLREYHPA